MSILDQIFDEAEKARLQAASNATNKTAPLPTAALDAIQNRLMTSSFDNTQLENDLSMTAFDPSQEQIDMNLAGVLNEGIPIGLRAKISASGVTNPEVNKKNILFNLKKYFKEEGLIDDNYDFGLRIGPQSKRLEFLDPRPEFKGKYNVLDPLGAADLLTGDLADLTGDIPTIIAEVSAAIGTTLIPGVGQSGVANIAAASAAAFATELARLKLARETGILSPEVTNDDILRQALDTAKWSALGGAGGQLLYKFGRPILSKLGIVSPKLRFDMDEESFIKAYDSWVKTPAAKASADAKVQPSSAQVMIASIDEPGISAAEKANRIQIARELAREEELLAKSSSSSVGSAVATPSLEKQILASGEVDKAIKGNVTDGMPPNVEAIDTSELALQKVGQGVRTGLTETVELSKSAVENFYKNELKEIDSIIDDAANLPVSIANSSQVGTSVKEAVGSAYESANQKFSASYEAIYKKWSEKTGINIDSVVIGKGGIKPTEAANIAASLKKTFSDRPFLSAEELKVVNKVYDAFVISEKGGAIGVKNISLRTLNENLRDLRRLERKAYLKSLKGEDAPYPETISSMVKALETARTRVLSRANAPKGLAEELKLLDDGFAEFSKKFRNSQLSAVAKLRTAKNPEAAFNLVMTPDKTGRTAVLEVADLLKKDPKNGDLLVQVGDSIREQWLKNVVKRNSDGVITKIDTTAHNAFVEKYGTVMKEYLSPEALAKLNNASDFGEIITQINAKRTASLSQLDETLELGGALLREPEKLFSLVWQPENITRFQKVIPILNREPQLKKIFQARVFKEMTDENAGLVQNINGVMVPDTDLMSSYIRNNKDKLGLLFSPEYVQNLNKVLTAMKPALTNVGARAAKEENNVLLTAARSFVGVFTRPGRVLTFVNKIRGKAREDALVQALIDPVKLRAMAQASKMSPAHSEAVKVLGRIFIGNDGEFSATSRTGNLDDINVPKPSSAKAILDSLQK
jgi:hypothetical protein